MTQRIEDVLSRIKSVENDVWRAEDLTYAVSELADALMAYIIAKEEQDAT